MSYYLRGQIAPGDPFLIIGIDDENTPFYLGDSLNTSDFGFHLFQNYATQGAATPRQFAAQHISDTQKNLFDFTSSLYHIEQGSTGQVFLGTSQGEFYLQPVDYNVTGMYTGVLYHIQNTGGKNLIFPVVDNLNNKTDLIDTVRFLPMTWFNSSKAGTCTKVSGLSNIMSFENNWINQVGQKVVGFTNMTECKVGKTYDYCLADQICGACFGNCPKQYSCVNRDGQFHCETKTTQKGEPSWLYLLLFVLLVVFVIFTIIFAVRF